MCLNLFITRAYFRNDKVKEDDTCHNYDSKPHDPEDDVLKIVQLRWSIKIEISKRDTKDGADVGEEIGEMLVFLVWIAQWIMSQLSSGWIMRQLIVTNFQNAQNG